MNIPKDPNMLYSFLNMQLRDNYSSLNDLCLSLGLSEEDILSTLEKSGFRYDSELNKLTSI